MEQKQPLFATLAPRQFSDRVARSVPELTAIGSGERPFLLETADRPESAAGLTACWHTLLYHKTAVLAASLGGLFLGLLIGVPMSPVFRASTVLEVLNINEDFMNMKPTQAAVPGTDSDNLSEEETQATLLQSQPLLDRVYAKLDPNPGRPAYLATSGWRSWFHLREGGSPSARDVLLRSAAQSLRVTNTPRTRILRIDVDSKDSQLALEFTNVLVQEFIKQNIDARWSSTQQTGDWLNQEISEARDKLRNSEDALQAYARNSNLFFIESDGDKQTNIGIGTEKLREIQQELSAATANRITKQSVFELARNSPPDALADILNDASLQELGARLNAATRQVASLSAVYNNGYAKLQQAQAEVVPLSEAFASRRAALLHRIETDYQSAARREKLLSAAYDAQAREVSGQDERAVQYNVLKREVDSNRQLYDTMLQEMKQASIATALHASNVRVIDPAYLQDRPVSPNLRFNCALGLLGGFICSVGFIFLREKTDRTFRQPGEVKLWASLPELGVIPSLPQKVNRSVWRLGPRIARGRDGNHDNGSGVPRERLELLNVAHVWDKPTVMIEAFQSALASILLAGDSRENGSVLVFTSVGPSDGKTSVVSNIAIAATKTGRKVLLVDADLRRPRVHDVFGLRKMGGIAEMICSEEVHNFWPALIQQPAIARLSVITAGVSRRLTTSLFYSPKFSALLDKWRAQYDLVLIDTPPAMHIPDARVIGALADGVVLVARAGQTTRDSLLAIQERFTADRIRLLGCILNDWDPNRSGNPYPYYRTEEETFA